MFWIIGALLMGFAVYQLMFGGSKKKQEPEPPETVYGGN